MRDSTTATKYVKGKPKAEIQIVKSTKAKEGSFLHSIKKVSLTLSIQEKRQLKKWGKKLKSIRRAQGLPASASHAWASFWRWASSSLGVDSSEHTCTSRNWLSGMSQADLQQQATLSIPGSILWFQPPPVNSQQTKAKKHKHVTHSQYMCRRTSMRFLTSCKRIYQNQHYQWAKVLFSWSVKNVIFLPNSGKPNEQLINISMKSNTTNWALLYIWIPQQILTLWHWSMSTIEILCEF